MNKQIALFGFSSLVLIISFVLGIKFYKDAETQKLSFLAEQDSKVFVRDHSPIYGNKKAKVYLIEFMDPECETCRALYHPVKNILKNYKDQVQLVIRYAPFHKNSQVAVRALEAARLQGKYWEALETLFHYQPFWGDHHNPKPHLIFEYLKKLNLNMDKLKKDMLSPKIAEMVNQDIKDLKQLGVRQTPTFFVNGKPLEKFGLKYLNELILSEVKKFY